jgi:hypothetical protein
MLYCDFVVEAKIRVNNWEFSSLLSCRRERFDIFGRFCRLAFPAWAKPGAPWLKFCAAFECACWLPTVSKQQMASQNSMQYAEMASLGKETVTRPSK